MSVGFYSVLTFLCFGFISCEDQLLREIQELKITQNEIKSLLVEVFLELNHTDRTVTESVAPLVTTNPRSNDLDLLRSQLEGLERKVKDMENRNADMTAKYNTLLLTNKNALSPAGGTYVRWGRKDCPGNDTELVYSGFAGGSWYDHIGAAAEFVCLPPDPDLTTKYTSSYAFIYGAEYDSGDFAPRANNGDDLPCSVCRSTVGSSVLMIPGKSSCYEGWSLQYHGDLVSGVYNQNAASQYICLDEHSQTLRAGYRNDNGKLFHPVKAVCGALACPPYRDNSYLTCVVCTK
uniref:Short-chain collagen C4-like isoform X2 n=1 Tax=Crassostrea virginica TaxID=6565 RepID=A0A8B8B787_CRAVI|nr:short-chain collagen C4-like isoform X2 [Crassostrea virginica]